MINNDELALKLKSAADKAVDNFDPNMFILTRDMAALLAERDADKAENELLRQQVAYLEESKANLATLYDMNLCDMLPGPQYMDPPDGGQVEPLEQVARMVEDYRQRIAELETLTSEQDKRLVSYAAIATKNASEARTVSVKIKPPTIGRAYSALAHVWTVQEVREACAAAGIKLEVGE